jgi:hypothetical protein
VCDDAGRDAATARAHERFRWSLGGSTVNPELRGTSSAGPVALVSPTGTRGVSLE